MSSKGNGSSVQLPPTAGVSTADTAVSAVEEDLQHYASQDGSHGGDLNGWVVTPGYSELNQYESTNDQRVTMVIDGYWLIIGDKKARVIGDFGW